MTHLVLRPLIPIRGQAVGHHGPGPGHEGLGLDLGPPGAPEMETYGPWDLLWGDQQREWML